MNTTTLLCRGLVALLLASSLAAATAQPQNRPIRMLVGFPPGQATDSIARVLARRLSTELGQPVVVDNKPGQGGSLALAELARSPSDGSVITLSALASYAINPHLYKSVPYDSLRDLAPVALVGEIPVVLVTSTLLEARTFEEFLAYVRANPGKLSHSSSGNGTVSHLGMQELKRRAELDILHVPYQGSARAMSDLVANQVQVGLDSVAATKALIDAKRLNILAVASPRRLSMFPDVPTIAELGFPGFAVSAWTGVSLPAAAPMEVRKRLNQAIVRIVDSPEFAAELQQLGATTRSSSIEEFEAFLRSEYERWGAAVKASGAVVQ